ncbi:MAG: hypothetical protein LBQ57_09890 [Spirochaetales bacterium]|jgi:vacuolar-type H+-ATPase subunit E/Vma4|nr:hypothetical protein [Spirochaetales bacterium]
MEDIRSSEVLEKEVLEDARKRAERILKNADRQIAGLEKEWKEKKESGLSLLNAEAASRKELQKRETDAAFPLETQRRKLKFLDGVFENFLSGFFEKLQEEDLARILSERGKSFAAFFAGRTGRVEVSYSGIRPETARRICSSLLGKTDGEPAEAQGFQGLIFTGPGGEYRYRLTVDEILTELREYHRKQIMDALWKERN